MFEKYIFLNQVEIKFSIKQNNTGTFLLNELSGNCTKRSLKKVLHDSLVVVIEELNYFNKKEDKSVDEEQE